MEDTTDQDVLKKYNDHDLLIILHTNLSHVMGDVNAIRTDTAGQIKELQLLKHDKEAAEKMNVAADLIHADHERRLRRIERYVSIGIGICIVLQLYTSGRISLISGEVAPIASSIVSTSK